MPEYTLDENGFIVPRKLWNESHEVGKTPLTAGRGRGNRKSGNKQKKPIVKVLPNVPRPTKKLVECATCRQLVRSDRLQRHMLKVHREHITPTITGRAASSGPTAPMEHLEQAFIQSHDEPMDGGKYLGHMEREWDGKFGSLPLYDDYNDESDADAP